jgi:hypothetical protein
LRRGLLVTRIIANIWFPSYFEGFGHAIIVSIFESIKHQASKSNRDEFCHCKQPWVINCISKNLLLFGLPSGNGWPVLIWGFLRYIVIQQIKDTKVLIFSCELQSQSLIHFLGLRHFSLRHGKEILAKKGKFRLEPVVLRNNPTWIKTAPQLCWGFSSNFKYLSKIWDIMP